MNTIKNKIEEQPVVINRPPPMDPLMLKDVVSKIGKVVRVEPDIFGGGRIFVIEDYSKELVEYRWTYKN